MAKFSIYVSSKFKNQFKKLSKFDRDLSNKVIFKLSNGETLDTKYKDHQLKGKFKEFRECHIKPNLLLIYKIIDDELVLYLFQIGSHSDLF